MLQTRKRTFLSLLAATLALGNCTPTNEDPSSVDEVSLLQMGKNNVVRVRGEMHSVDFHSPDDLVYWQINSISQDGLDKAALRANAAVPMMELAEEEHRSHRARAAFRAVFRIFDKDADNAISKSEFARGLASTVPERWSKDEKSVEMVREELTKKGEDHYADHFENEEALVNLVEEIMNESESIAFEESIVEMRNRKSFLKDFKAAFKMFDRDGNGKISRGELVMGIRLPKFVQEADLMQAGEQRKKAPEMNMINYGKQKVKEATIKLPYGIDPFYSGPNKGIAATHHSISMHSWETQVCKTFLLSLYMFEYDDGGAFDHSKA